MYMKLYSNLTPILLFVACLATYNFVYGNLLPSVAITSLGVFMSLESILEMLVQIMVFGIGAKVSCEKVERFLRSPKRSRSRNLAIGFHFVMRLCAYHQMTECLEKIGSSSATTTRHCSECHVWSCWVGQLSTYSSTSFPLFFSFLFFLFL